MIGDGPEGVPNEVCHLYLKNSNNSLRISSMHCESDFWRRPRSINNPNEDSSHMKAIIILLSLFVAVSLAAAYTPEQQTTIDGVRLSFQLGQAYDKAIQGQNIPAFNALVDQWNAWVVKSFGNDTTLLMSKMAEPLNLQKPYMAADKNTTSNGITHTMDSVSKYTTNDINLMPDSAISKYASSDQGKAMGSDFLGGV